MGRLWLNSKNGDGHTFFNNSFKLPETKSKQISSCYLKNNIRHFFRKDTNDYNFIVTKLSLFLIFNCE